MSQLPSFDFSIYLSLAFLFGIAAQFRAMDGYSFLRSLLAAVERRTGILYAVVLVTFVFSPFILNDVVVIILTPVLIRYARQHGVDPVPMIVAEITMTNVASSLTPLGNPQNILLWTSTNASFQQFVAGTWWYVLLSALLVVVVLLPYARKLERPREPPTEVTSKLPGVYLAIVVAATISSDFLGLKPYEALGVAFALGLPFALRSLRQVAREFDYAALSVLYLFVTAVTLFSFVLGPSLEPLVAPVAQGSQPYSGVFVAVASNLISNVPLTQLILNTASVSAQVAPRLAVAAGFAGNLGPVASFANLLALQIARSEGVSVRRTILLQLLVGFASFLPALL